MKVGIRKPNIKKSIKARTTGKIKRAVKRSVNPLYGKKGMGMIKDPKKAMYNKIYNKTTVGVPDMISSSSTPTPTNKRAVKTPSRPLYKFLGVVAMVFAILFLLIGIISFAVGGFIFIIPSVLLFFFGKRSLNLSK